MSDNLTEREKFFEDVIRQWTECNQVCDLASPRKRKIEGLEKADRYMEILPGADYVLTQTLNYIFSNGLTTGSILQDEKLGKFLYRVNDRETTNLHELRDTIGMAITHGASGLRWLNGNVYQYKWGTYRALTYMAGGIRKIVAYVVAKDGGYVEPFKFDYTDYKEYRDFLSEFNKKDLILLTRNEFKIIRNDTSYDIRYDGPGRLVLRPKDGYIQGDNTDISATQAMSGALENNQKQVEAIKLEAARVAKEIKDSKSDSAIVVSNAFDEKITHLPRVTKATEFFEWLKSDTMILAQDFGMAPSLLELGGVSGNVSMTSIIDTAMENSIVPLRERFAVQVSSFLSPHLNVEKIYFNKYEMRQQEDVNTMRTKIVNILSLLNAMRVKEGDGEVIQPMAQQLFEDFATMLSDEIHNEIDQLEEL